MTDYERIAKVIRHLDQNFREQPSLSDLARVAGLSESHFHRLFTRWAGTTPKSFLKFITAEHAKRLLLESRDLLDTSLETGLSGPGRLHDLLVTVEAMSPGEFKARGEGLEILHGTHATAFGTCFIGLTGRGICHLAFCDSQREADAELAQLRSRWPKASFRAAPRTTASAVRKLFVTRERQRLLMLGTPFQLKVWQALLRVPAGHVVSYSDIARSIGSAKASRAVGTAVAGNSIAYLIPCHRVIRETGHFGQYRWGAERKRALLAWEGSSHAGS